VREFVLLRLNAQICEMVVFGTARGDVTPECEVDGCVMPCSGVGKCLGFWWRRDLLATRCVDENIKKARRAFFNFGSIGVFQGSLNPLSSASVIETCVMPILLYGTENWILTSELLKKLESFQGSWLRELCGGLGMTQTLLHV